MKIGPKLAICFVALAVTPLVVTSFIYARSSSELGRNMAATGKEFLSNRVSEDLDRATDLSVQALRELRAELQAETESTAAEIARRLTLRPDPDIVEGAAARAFAAEAAEDRANGINLARGNVRIEEGADRATVMNTLARLEGLTDVGRISYLRNRASVRATSIALEDGVTVWYPGGSVIEETDHRESEWYLNTLERQQPLWYLAGSSEGKEFFATAPVITPHGKLAGVLRTIAPVQQVLNTAIPAASVPTNATAYFIVVPYDHPNLFPHTIAVREPDTPTWKVSEELEPLDFEGDESWLKVLSDIRSGVRGLEVVRRGDKEEIWSFRPVAAIDGAELHLAIAQPKWVVEIAEQQVETIVDQAFTTQLRNIAIFAFVVALLAIALGLWAARMLTHPIRELHGAAARLAKGDFSVRVENKSGDELSDLADDFNAMVPALEDRLKVKRDLDIAREIQQYLVSQSPPAIEGFDIAGKTAYCDETGGDYQDFIELQGGEGMAAVIGDVTGHGVGAALLMAAARSSFRAHMRNISDDGQLMEAVNKDLSADSSGGRFLTLFFTRLRPGSRSLTWMSAGHETALIFDPASSEFTELSGDGIPLGVDTTWNYQAEKATIPENGVLIAYTDGLREAKDGSGERFGVNRLKNIIREMHPRGSETICDHVLAEWKTYCEGADIVDDVSLMIIKAV